MNQQCKVCGEPAAGFHFGAFTCEGCKSFFGRTYNNLSSISECKNNGECVINKKNRTACKACRLRKCLLVGMSKSGSRYGRRSNWFKIHCLLQEQQNKVNNNNNSVNANQSVNSNNNNNNSNNSNNSNPSNLLQNDFISTHLLANFYNNYNNNNNNSTNGTIKVQEIIKRVSSPSDSGASSSADIDETSLKCNNNNITKSKNLNVISQKVRSNSYGSEKHEKVNSSPSDGYSSPINSNLIKPAFLPFPLTNHHHHHHHNHHHQSSSSSSSRVPSTPELLMLTLPQISLTAASHKRLHSSNNNNNNNNNNDSYVDEMQNEPIDLSLKSSSSKRSRTNSDNDRKSIRSSSSPDIHEPTAASAVTKTVPLDLTTLVRSG